MKLCNVKFHSVLQIQFFTGNTGILKANVLDLLTELKLLSIYVNNLCAGGHAS